MPPATALPAVAVCCGTEIFIEGEGLHCLADRGGALAPGDIAAGTNPMRPVGRLSTEALETLSIPIDINTATADALERLPGVGPSIARKIVESRQANGPFADAHALERVLGIGPSIADRIRKYLAGQRHVRTAVCQDRLGR